MLNRKLLTTSLLSTATRDWSEWHILPRHAALPSPDHQTWNLPVPRLADDQERHGDGTGEVLAPEETKLKPPPLYRVVLLNDDYTPMEFVVDVLRKFFGMDMETATRVMLKVHTEGKGVCGVFPKDVAETKCLQVNDYAREAEHPLLCDIEVDD